MNVFNIVAVLVLLFVKTGVDSGCIETMQQLSQILGDSLKELQNTKNELKKVRAELEAERNKSITPTTKNPQIPAVYECTFENVTGCGYSLPITDKNAHWFLGHGRRAMKTGPEADHTLGTADGHYLYIDGVMEAEQPENVFDISKTAKVEFPTIVPKSMSEFCISFWYSMYGEDIKTLRFYLNQGDKKNLDPVFQKDGDQGKGWKLFQHSLPKTKTEFSFSFEATTTAYADIDFTQNKILTLNAECNIAIDDIKVVASPCSDSTPTTTESTIVG